MGITNATAQSAKRPTRPKGKNFPLLWEVYEYIKEHRKLWRQSSWGENVRPDRESCGTRMCFAGHSIILGAPKVKQIWTPIDDMGNRTDISEAVRWVFAGVVAGGQAFDVAEYAQKILGLDYFEANELFQGMNRLRDIRALITRWEREAAAS